MTDCSDCGRQLPPDHERPAIQCDDCAVFDHVNDCRMCVGIPWRLCKIHDNPTSRRVMEL